MIDKLFKSAIMKGGSDDKKCECFGTEKKKTDGVGN